MKRTIPTIMATQHPDNASEVYWSGKAFVTTEDEIEECYRTFFELNCDEYMWDWEGKFADEAVIEKLYQKYFSAFKKKELGKDIFITLRLPNIWEEKSFKLTRAYMGILSAYDLAQSLGFKNPPVFETILPMTKEASQLIHIQETFRKIAVLKNEIFQKHGRRLEYINIIPLFESVECFMQCEKILYEYVRLHKKSFGSTPAYIRPFIARSDPAMNAGFIPAVLGCKIAISKVYEFSKTTGIPVFPIIGTGGLPFRGGANPENIKNTAHQYSGVRTFTIQSAFRYDYPLPSVKKAIQYLKRTLPRQKPDHVEASEVARLYEIIQETFIPEYRRTVEKSARLINEIAEFVPRRRERALHIGLFGYSRGVGKTKLPRAIQFTAAWYSLGIPPEIIATGRGLFEAEKKGLLPLIGKYFPTLRNEIVHACKYLNLENLTLLKREYPHLGEIEKDVKHIENILGIKLGPHKPNHYIHRNLVSTIVMKRSLKQDFSHEIIEAGKMRKSLG